MSSNTPIYSIAKELNVDSNRIILACKSIGIPAKGATKRLNLKNYFSTGKNVSEETIEINKKNTKKKSQATKIIRDKKINYFPNRLIAKS